jgi:hypothetical protein
MRKIFLSLGVVFAVLIAAPAAEAHYIINQQVTCDLVSNVPTITASADFASFGSPDQNVHVVVGVDGAVPIDQHLPYAPAGGHWSATTPSTAGDHNVYIYITWTHYGTPNDSSYGPTTVTCPPPVPPPVVITPTPTPPPPVTVYYDCAGHQLPAGSPPATCPPTKPPCRCAPPKPKVHCPVIHLIMPAARHGVHDFGGRCSKGKIINTTLYITATGPRGGDMKHGRRIVCGTAKLHAKGAIIHGVWLYDQTVFCHRQAWGSYSLIFVFHVRIHGHVYRCVKRAHFFNHDPGGYPDTLAHVARSSWGQGA